MNLYTLTSRTIVSPISILSQVRFASKKTGGTTKNNRDSQPKYRGIKLQNNAVAGPGKIIVRQVGSKFHEGEGVKRGKDFTLYAVNSGKVRFWFDLERQRRMVSIDDGKYPQEILENLMPTKGSVKREIVSRMNSQKYLKMTPIERYQHIREIIQGIVAEQKQWKVDNAENMLLNKRRKFDLIDLTTLSG
ncbi:54S ribosomal protein L2 mitochondrial [Nowakowskiella sp. JEL0407]|nr:54S ribosomal protein L2 mitochondrial [Nowakowskiella sp. JEL0407]